MKKKTGNIINGDAQLWDSFRNGDDDVLSGIYDTHIQALFKYGSKLSHDEFFVMDCIHDLFVYLIQHRATVGRTDNILFYLILSLKRKMLHSRKKYTTDIFDEHAFFLESASDNDGDQACEDENDRHQRRRLRDALNKLPERQKEAIYLRYIMDFKNEEIAQIMEINYQSVRNMLHKAIEFLRKNLSKEDFILFVAVIKNFS